MEANKSTSPAKRMFVRQPWFPFASVEGPLSCGRVAGTHEDVFLVHTWLTLCARRHGPRSIPCSAQLLASCKRSCLVFSGTNPRATWNGAGLFLLLEIEATPVVAGAQCGVCVVCCYCGHHENKFSISCERMSGVSSSAPSLWWWVSVVHRVRCSIRVF